MTTFSSEALKGKVAVVTGAASADVVGLDICGLDICEVVSPIDTFAPATRSDLDEVGQQIEKLGRRWLGIVADQRQIGQLRAAAEQIKSTFGGLDIVFANAGIQAFKPLLEMEDADWHDQIDNNLTGTANTLRAFAPALVARGGGRIIVTSSTQGQHGTLNGSSYAASKWGIIGLMKSAALELGKHKITVNALIPGLIDTVLTLHEDRYAQAIASSGKQPTGHEAEDEAAAATGRLKTACTGCSMSCSGRTTPAVATGSLPAASPSCVSWCSIYYSKASTSREVCGPGDEMPAGTMTI